MYSFFWGGGGGGGGGGEGEGKGGWGIVSRGKDFDHRVIRIYHMTLTDPHAISLENHMKKSPVRVIVTRPEKRVRPY